MNNNTKIIVIHKLHLIIAAAIIGIIAIILLLITLTPKTQTPPAINTSATQKYAPGVYTAPISLDNNPLTVRVTLDQNNINSIDLIYNQETIPTAYPMLSESFNEIAQKVCAQGTTQGITLTEDTPYTTQIILQGITTALTKATPH